MKHDVMWNRLTKAHFMFKWMMFVLDIFKKKNIKYFSYRWLMGMHGQGFSRYITYWKRHFYDRLTQ